MNQVKNANNRPQRILIVEDDESFLTLMEDTLLNAGYEVTGVTNGVKARELLETGSYDLVMSDWRVPDLGGIDLLCFVQQHVGIPFVLMTGFSDFIAQKDIYDSGAAAFLPKPFNKNELFTLVETCLENTSAA